VQFGLPEAWLALWFAICQKKSNAPRPAP
jgi:hypothetical protein